VPCRQDRVSGSRKRFKAALALLEAGESEALIFTKVDRASRCTEDFARLIRLSEEQGWRLIVTEMGIDTRTPMGKAMAHMAVVCARARARTRPRSTPDDVCARARARTRRVRIWCCRPEKKFWALGACRGGSVEEERRRIETQVGDGR
jgi:DNA invertase Pin-like site-specific DNA recombinase